MLNVISEWILKIIKWEVVGGVPDHIKKSIIVVMPHTSNWDFPLGLLTRRAIRRNIGFIAKDSLFVFPFGYFFRWLGGYPVDRSKKANYVQAVADVFRKEKEMLISIAPEGTRKKVDKLKTGFYYIAKEAEIPMIFCSFDYGTRKITFSEPYYPTDDMAKDWEVMLNYFKGVKGKIQENSFLN